MWRSHFKLNKEINWKTTLPSLGTLWMGCGNGLRVENHPLADCANK
jgi:hypothetical protein